MTTVVTIRMRYGVYTPFPIVVWRRTYSAAVPAVQQLTLSDHECAVLYASSLDVRTSCVALAYHTNVPNRECMEGHSAMLTSLGFSQVIS